MATLVEVVCGSVLNVSKAGTPESAVGGCRDVEGRVGFAVHSNTSHSPFARFQARLANAFEFVARFCCYCIGGIALPPAAAEITSHRRISTSTPPAWRRGLCSRSPPPPRHRQHHLLPRCDVRDAMRLPSSVDVGLRCGIKREPCFIWRVFSTTPLSPIGDLQADSDNTGCTRNQRCQCLIPASVLPAIAISLRALHARQTSTSTTTIDRLP